MASKKLDDLVKSIQKEYGTGSIMDLRKSEDAFPRIERVPIDSPKIGDALGFGGVPRGRIIEIFGPESGGKTSMATYLSGQFQKREHEYIDDKGKMQKRRGVVLYIDAEHAIDLQFAKVQGFDMSQALLVQPDSGEDALDIAIDAAESGEIDLVVIDSIAALTPLAELEGDMDDQQMGLQARMMSKFCRKAKAIFANNNCTLIAINQIRHKIGGWGNPETTPGGNALKFFSSIRIEMRKREFITEGGEVVGLQVGLKVVKNKTAPPMKRYVLDLDFKRGFDSFMEWIDFAVETDVIKQGGPWYHLPTGEKIQGKLKVIDHYTAEENAEAYQAVIEETRKRKFSRSDSSVTNADVEEVPEEIEEEPTPPKKRIKLEE